MNVRFDANYRIILILNSIPERISACYDTCFVGVKVYSTNIQGRVWNLIVGLSNTEN
jgi:hypothetical protein